MNDYIISISNVFTKKRNVIIFFLASLSLLIATLIFTNFEILAYRARTIMHDIKMASIDVDGFQISQVLIDQDGREYNSSYTWNATNYDERRSLTLQINYKKTNNNSYEPGELVFAVPNMVTMKSYFVNNSDNEDSIISSSNPCSLSEKVTTWNWSYDNTRCSANNYSNKIDSRRSDYIYFTNTEKIEANTNFEGSIRILFNEIYPESILNGLDNTFHTTLNNKLNTNNIRFRFTSNKRSYTMDNGYYKIKGYDSLPSNAANYIWIRINLWGQFKTGSNVGVRRFVSMTSTGEEHQLSGGISYKPYKYGKRYRFSLPSNAIVYSPYENYTYETENGVGYYRYNGGNYYYNGKSIYLGNDDIYIGLPKSQYTNKTVSITTYLYGLYADYDGYFDPDKTHNYEYITSETKTIDTANYIYEPPDSDYLYTTSQSSSRSLDVNNLRSGSYIEQGFNVVYTGTKLKVKVGNDVFYKKNTSGSISRLSDSYYYYHGIRWDNDLRDSSGKQLLPIYNIELYVRHRGSNNYVKYGETFTNDRTTKDFVFTETDIVGFYFMIYNVDTSIISGGLDFNVVYTGNISQGDEIFNSSYIEAYKYNSSSVINTPSSSLYDNIDRINDIGSYLKSYDSSTYGHYMRRSVSSNIAKKTNAYLYIYSSEYSSLSSSMYKRNIYEAYDYFNPRSYSNDYYNSGYIKQNKGYEMYLLLPEGFYTDPQKLVTVSCSNYSHYLHDYNSGFIKKSNGTKFNDRDDYCNYVKDHMTTQVINNWKNTNRTLMKVVVDFRDAPLDFTDFIYYNPSLLKSLSYYQDYYLPEDFYFYFYYDKENIAEYNQTRFDIPKYLKPIGVTVPTNTDFEYAVRDELDINSNGNTSEYLTGGNSYINVLFTGESNQDLTSFVRSEDDQYNSDHTVVTANDTYSYKLRARTATNKITNLVIYDSLENYVKENGEFVKAAGDATNTFKGTFMGIDTSYAQNQGYNVKTYYSESETPGSLGSDSSWKTYTEGTTDKTKVKSLAFEYYKSNGTTKAIIPTESLTYVVINMKAPNNIDGNKVVAYNGSWSEWNALDYNNNIVPNVVGISSNKVSTAIKSVLRVKHYIKGTTTEIAPSEEYETFGGYEYTTSRSNAIPSDYTFDSNAGDATSGTITKLNTEVIYYYKKKDPILTSTVNKTGTDTLEKRKDAVSYQITYTGTVKDFIGTANVTIVDNLPYEIDTTKEYNLDGGTYNANNKTITWNKTIETTSITNTSKQFTFNISFSYKNIPVEIRSITNKVIGTVRALEKTASAEKTKSTSITEQFKLTVHHYYQGTTNSIKPDVVTYEDGGVAYNTTPAELPADYDITTPANAAGIINQEETTVTYYYQRKDPALNGRITKTGTELITSFDTPVEYKVYYETTVADYIGEVAVTVIDTLPYEIDTTKEYELSGGTYDAENKTITWTITFDKTIIDSQTNSYTYDLKFTYKDVEKSNRGLINSVVARTVLDNKNIEKTTLYAVSVAVKGKITTKYIDIDTEKELSKPLVSEDYIFLNKYVPEAKEIDTYDLVESPEDNEYDYKEEEQTIYYKYKKRKHKIITKVSGNGGTITGDEEIDEGTDSTKDNIVIKANVGYSIQSITINGKEIEISEGLGTYTLDYFKDVREDKEIIVDFIKKPKLDNPETGTFASIIIISILLLGGIVLYLYSKKLFIFKRL